MLAPGNDRSDHRVLVVDDDAAMATMLAEGLADLGYQATSATNGADATALVRDAGFDVVVTDLRMPGTDGMELLELSKRVAVGRPVIVMTAFGAIDTAVESLRKGAYHYLLKPFKVAELDLFLQRALEDRALRRQTETLKRAFAERYDVHGLVAKSEGMREACELALRVADADVPVLITGETGTGKGRVARLIHANGARASGPFVSVNCAALPDTLLESELFGHVKGAFTGATSNRRGLLLDADGGTLFLDEIGDMLPALQAKLLHVVEHRTVRAVGSSREQNVDIRFVAATHRNLRARVREGLFREDLLYRLEGVAIEIPPLRQRRDDIPELVAKFLHDARAQNPKSPVEALSREAMECVLGHSWPGNVRELEHAMSRAVLLGRDREALPKDLPAAMHARPASGSTIDFGTEVLPVRELKRRYAAWALERLGGRKTMTCERLGLDAKTLNKWLAEDDAKDD